ncbi:MAG: hypothetical protein ACJAQT_005136 [Akkermansiaceae bacterium]|jgi:hypothetical protein
MKSGDVDGKDDMSSNEIDLTGRIFIIVVHE